MGNENMWKKVLVGLLLLICMSTVNAQNFVEGLDVPQIGVDQKFGNDITVVSSAIQTLPVSNPYAAAGQPVFIDFTLKNIGQEYPFNQIPLIPDQYLLLMTTDKDLGITLKDGTRLDVWSDMSSFDKVMFVFSLGTSQAQEFIGKALEGRQCGYVDVYPILPLSVQEKLTKANGGKKVDHVYTWECVKIVDKPFFDDKIKNTYCKGGQITEACLAKVNQDFGNSVNSTVKVLLTSDKRGVCTRPTDDAINQGDWLKGIGNVLTNKGNLVTCGIGKDGLKPNEQVTLRFVGIVPADSPVVPPADFLESQTAAAGITQSASCLDSEFPKNCHVIYAAVVPVQQTNVLQILNAGTLDLLGNAIGGAGTAFLTGNLQNYENYTKTHASSPAAVGDPIWEGAGTFLIVGPQLEGYLSFILIGAVLAGFVATGGKK